MFSFASTGSLSCFDSSNTQPFGDEIGYEDEDGGGVGADILSVQHTDFDSGFGTQNTNPPNSLSVFETNESRLSRYTALLDAILKRHSTQPIFINTLDVYMNTLENAVERSMNDQLAREEQRALFEKLKNGFITEYLKTCPYYYLPDVKLFIEYQCETFGVVQESRIWSDIITTIEADESLIPYKYKIRTEILQQIRQRHIWRCTPESSTIQGVLNLMTSFFFPNKEVAKYFLTILGDDLLGKTSSKQITYLSTARIDEVISTLSYQFSRYVRHKIHNVFKKNIHISNQTSTHLSEPITNSADEVLSESINSEGQIINLEIQPSSACLSNLRILQTRSDIPTSEYWEDHIRTKILDIISVAFHYSIRFENAENFLETYCSLPSVYNSAHVFADYSLYKLLSVFLGHELTTDLLTINAISPNEETSEIIQPSITDVPSISILPNDLAYLWKAFISEYGVIDTFIMRPCIKLVQEYITAYPSITSHLIKRLKLPHLFKEFISTTMTPYTDEDYEHNTAFQYSDVYVYDTDEILKIFKMWIQLNHPEIIGDVNREIGADQILKMIMHYYNSAVRIVDGKTVYGWRCSMWDKPAMIIEYLKTDGRPHKYTDFCKFLKEKQITLIPSKAYYDRMAEN